MASVTYNRNTADPIFEVIAAALEARKTFEIAVKALSVAEGECYKLRHLFPRTITLNHKGIKKQIRSHDELRAHFQMVHPRHAIGPDRFTQTDLLAWEAARDAAHRELDAVLASYQSMRKRYNLDALEADEIAASKAVWQAELRVIETRPRTLEGSAALLRFLIGYLEEDNSIDAVIDALGNVESALLELAPA